MDKKKFGKKDIFATVERGKEIKEVINLKKAKTSDTKIKEEDLAIPVRKPKFEENKTIVHTFRIKEELLEKVREYAFFERVNIYEVINRSIEDFLGDYKPMGHTPHS